MGNDRPIQLRKPLIDIEVVINMTAMQRKFLPLVFYCCLLVQCVPLGVDGCPKEMCVCKWKNGKQTAECMNRRLGEFPSGLDAGTQVLNFSGNSVTYLQENGFSSLNLINLQKVFLMRNEIARIHEHAFLNLTNLVELDLSENLLTVVPSDSFPDVRSLMRLALNGNPIRALRASGFKNLTFLTTLELTNCQIELVEQDAFQGMDNLEWLRLDGNRIKTIRGTYPLPGSLHGISLQGNRWTCDCAMLDMHRWLVASTIPQTEEPQCVQPTRLAGSLIRAVDRGKLACLPEITPKSLSLDVAENHNLTLRCRVEAIPAATITWYYQSRSLDSNYSIIGTHSLPLMSFTMEQGEPEKHFDLFISNTTADTNGTFVCAAENSGGWVQATYTVKVIGKGEPQIERVNYHFEYYLIFVAGTAGMSIIVMIIVCILLLKCCCQRRRQPNGRRGICNGSNGRNDSGANVHWKKNPSSRSYNYANDSDRLSLNNGSGADGIGSRSTTLITAKGVSIEGGLEQQFTGGLDFMGKQNMIMYVSGGLMDPTNQQTPKEDRGIVQQQQTYPFSGVGGRTGAAGLVTSTSSITSSPSHLVRNYSPDPINPDLINDTEKQRLTSEGGDNSKPLTTNGQIYGNSNKQHHSGQSNSLNVNIEVGQLRELNPQCYNKLPNNSHLGTLPRTKLREGTFPTLAANSKAETSSDHHQFNHRALALQTGHQADVHLNPSSFLSQTHLHQPQSQPLHNPFEYTVTTTAMNMLQPHLTYRTLPHRLKMREVSTTQPGTSEEANNAAPIRFVRDAEFFTAAKTHAPQFFDMYTPTGNIRYTAAGYPYTQLPFLAVAPMHIASSGTTTKIASTQQLVAYQDATNLQFLPSPPEGYKVTDTNDGLQKDWPVCLPAYEKQAQTMSQVIPIKTNFAQRFTSPLNSPVSSVTSSTSSSKMSTCTNTNNHQQINGNASLDPLMMPAPAFQSLGADELPATVPPPPTKRCVGAQTTEMGRNDEIISSGHELGSRRSGVFFANSLKQVDETEEDTSDTEQRNNVCRRLNGPLADSPDEGYVGDSGHDGSSE